MIASSPAATTLEKIRGRWFAPSAKAPRVMYVQSDTVQTAAAQAKANIIAGPASRPRRAAEAVRSTVRTRSGTRNVSRPR